MLDRTLTQEDFDRAVRNPFFYGLNKKVEVDVRNDDYELFSKIAEMNEETPESVMRRMLINSADFIREHDDDE